MGVNKSNHKMSNAPTHDLPQGISVKAESAFLRLVKEAFRRLDDFPLRDSPGKTEGEANGVYVGAEESSVDEEYLPQVRVTCGDASDYKGAIDRLKDWAPNVTNHTLVTQGYTQIAVYSANDVESRDISDYLKSVVLRARKDLGKRGIFGVRDLKSTKPKGVEAGSHQDGIYLSRCTFAFMIVENAEYRNVSDPFLRKIGIQPEYEPRSEEDKSVDVSVQEFHYEPLVRLLFGQKVSPEYPQGFTVEIEGEPIPHTCIRDPFNKKRVRLELDEDPPRGSSVRVEYTPGTLSGESGEISSFEKQVA